MPAFAGDNHGIFPFVAILAPMRASGGPDSSPAEAIGQLLHRVCSGHRMPAAARRDPAPPYTATLSLSPSARTTFNTVANSGLPSGESAL